MSKIEHMMSITDIKKTVNALVDAVNELKEQPPRPFHISQSANGPLPRPEAEKKTKLCTFCGKEISVDVPMCRGPKAEKTLAEAMRDEYGAKMRKSAEESSFIWDYVSDVARTFILKEVEKVDIESILYNNWSVQITSRRASELVKNAIKEAISR